jgi:hypothetical protein
MSNHRGGNIFYRIINTEDNVTDVLCNLLQYKNIRDILLKYFKIPSEVIDQIKYEDVDTQIVNETKGRPDIVISNENVAVFIENKVKSNTPLQSKQVKEYLLELERMAKVGKRIWMIYLVPKNYKHVNKIVQAINSKDYTAIYYWEDFIGYIQQNDLHRNIPIVGEFIDRYADLFIKAKLTFIITAEEMELLLKPNDLVHANSLLSKLRKMEEEVLELLRNEFGERLTTQWSEDYWHNTSEKGVYVEIDGESVIYFGLWFDLYPDSSIGESKQPPSNDYLFCYSSGNDVDEKIKPAHLKVWKTFPDAFQYEGWYICKFPNYTLTGEDAPQKIAAVLKETINALIASR